MQYEMLFTTLVQKSIKNVLNQKKSEETLQLAMQWSQTQHMPIDFKNGILPIIKQKLKDVENELKEEIELLSDMDLDISFEQVSVSDSSTFLLGKRKITQEQNDAEQFASECLIQLNKAKINLDNFNEAVKHGMENLDALPIPKRLAKICGNSF